MDANMGSRRLLCRSDGRLNAGEGKFPLWVIRVDFGMSASCPVRGAISEMPMPAFAG